MSRLLRSGISSRGGAADRGRVREHMRGAIPGRRRRARRGDRAQRGSRVRKGSRAGWGGRARKGERARWGRVWRNGIRWRGRNRRSPGARPSPRHVNFEKQSPCVSARSVLTDRRARTSRAGPARTLRAEGGADFARRACAAGPVAGGPEMFLAPCLLGAGEKSGETAPEKSGEG